MREYRTDPGVYFGQPGRLIQLPWPQGGLTKPYERQVSDFVTGSGTHRVATLIGGARQYTVKWNALHVDNYALLEEHWTGVNGPGPFVLIDPSQPNLLTPNQAAASGVWNIVRGQDWDYGEDFTNGTPETNIDPSFIHRPRGNRSIQWLLGETFIDPGFTELVLAARGAYLGWPGIPVKDGLSYAWSSWVIPGLDDPTITVAAKIRWIARDGSTISESTGGDVSVNTSWTPLSCLAVAPPDTAYALPLFVVTASSLGTEASLYLDEMMFEQDTVVNGWAAGTGVNPLSIVNLTDDVPFDSRFREGISLTLREVVG